MPLQSAATGLTKRTQALSGRVYRPRHLLPDELELTDQLRAFLRQLRHGDPCKCFLQLLLEVLRKVLDAVPDLRYCLDVGHAHLDKRADGARKYLAVLGDRLGLAHIHDNHGGQGEAGDEHLPFGQGTIDLERDVTALKDRGYEGYATLEIFKGIPDDKKACLRKMRRWTREDPP